MTESWPYDGTYPWVGRGNGQVKIEWHDHLFSLTPPEAERLIETITDQVRAIQQAESLPLEEGT